MMIVIIRMYIKKKIIFYLKELFNTSFLRNICMLNDLTCCFMFRDSVDAALNAQDRKLPCKRPENLYKTYLENRYKLFVGTPKWAELEKSDKTDIDDLDSDILKVC